MKILGRIPGDEYVFDKSDGYKALKLVDSLPDPSSEDVRSVQLEVSSGDNKAGDIFTSDGTNWTKVESPANGVGSVTNIICPREGSDVRIRWADPLDRGQYVWKHTRLMRKYGSYPTSVLDGVVVTDSYVRDQYFQNELHDFLPAGTEDGWRYRFFTFSEDEVSYSSEGCMFIPIDLSWKTINQAIRDGHATKMFAIGDVIKIDYKRRDSPYAGINFEVADINQAFPNDTSKTHSVTFLATCALPGEFNWDINWSEFQLTTDTVVTNRNKEYFIKESEDVFTKITNLRLGQRLPADTYYERISTPERKEQGGNRWSRCELRRWLNSTKSTDVKNGMPPFLTEVTDEIAAAIKAVRNTTALARIDGGDYDITIDTIYIPSATEVYGTKSVKINYFKTTDKAPSEYYILTTDTERVSGKSYFIKNGSAYRKATSVDFDAEGKFLPGVSYYEVVAKQYYVVADEDTGEMRLAKATDFTDDNLFKDGVVYYEQNKVVVSENPQIASFADPDLDSKERYEVNGSSPVTWWLRTPDIESVSDVKAVSAEADHAIIDGAPSKVSFYHVVIMFTIS